MATDWTDAYTNGAYIPGGETYPQFWTEAATRFRVKFIASDRAMLGVEYGPRERNKLDLFLPSDAPKGLIVFVHGGYWHRFDRSLWSHLAEGALKTGWAVAIPSYTLAPDARIAEITSEIAAAINFSSTLVNGPIRLSGHSAGGHLVTRMMCHDTELSSNVIARLKAVVSISGLHDLRPLMKTDMNGILKLDELEAAAESPALMEPLPNIALTCFVGAIERPEFLRQNDLLANIWSGFDVPVRSIHKANCHHFNVVQGMQNRTSQLTRIITGNDGWG